MELSNTLEKSKRVTFKTGVWSYVIFLAIVALRALQPNAQPMCEWSFASWIWMTLPLTWHIFLFLIAKVIQLICDLVLIFVK